MTLEEIRALLEDYTMVPPPEYTANLQLAATAAEVPGAVVECGVCKGGMIAGIAALLGAGHKYWLFDSFQGLPPPTAPDTPSAGGEAADLWTGKCDATQDYAVKAMELVGAADYELVPGWFKDTLPGARFADGIAVLRLDGDWYESTTQALEFLFPQVNKGGVVLIDDYHWWPGCARAVHDYLSRHDLPECIEGSRMSGSGLAYIRKRGERE